MHDTTRKTARDFDPAVRRLFDQYVHGLIDRRGFMRGPRAWPWAPRPPPDYWPR